MNKFSVRFEINEKKAVKIARILHSQFKMRKGFCRLFNARIHLSKKPHTRKQRACPYFTYVISIDYMTDAEKLWSMARGAYELHPERFTPQKILQFSDNTVKTFVRRLGARFAPKATKTWKKISKIL